MESSKLPARGFALEMFLPEGEDYSRADGENWFFHGEDVVSHRLHVELVLLLVNREELAACGDVGDLNNAFDDDCFLREFGADDTLRILRKIAGLARLAPGAEQESTVLPQSPDDHCVRRAVGLHCGDPVVVRFLQALLGPGPGEQALSAFGETVSSGVDATGLRVCRLRHSKFTHHRGHGVTQGAFLILCGLCDCTFFFSIQTLQILLGPLIDAIESLLQVLHRIRYAETEVAFAVFAERSARERRDASLLEQCVR